MKRKICLTLFILPLLFIAAVYLFKPPYFYAYTRWLPTLINGSPSEQSLPNPLAGQRFSDTWQAARSGGRKHEGVDIFAKRGTPIHSATSGVVVKVGTNKLGGKFVSVMTGRTVHYYAHLEEYGKVKRHQWIEAGEIIGYVGDSGNAKGTPPHLHYGIYTPTGAVNPFPLIKQ